jgi:hypothetical protein
MSGRRHHDGEPGPTPVEHLKAELAGILRLLLKNAARHSVPLLARPAWTAFQTVFRVSLAADACPASGSTTAVPLLHPNTARLRRETGRPTVTLHRMPIFTAMESAAKCLVQNDFAISYIRNKELLSNYSRRTVRVLDSPTTTPVMKRLPVRLGTTWQAVPALPHRLRPRNDARMLALPIRKAPVPPHRFSLAMRQRFRQALAEKSGTPPDQIQLQLIFDRLNLNLYAAIRQDEQGYLLCTPKSDASPTDSSRRERGRFASQNRRALRPSLPTSADTSVFYLVIGLRLDTRQDVRALVSPAGEYAS